MKQVEVAAAILIKDGKVLCAQRGMGKFDYVSEKYEFPGGKLEPGESLKEALRRELMEELDLPVRVEAMQEFYMVEYLYPDFFLKMHCFLCHMPEEEIHMKEHVNLQWRTVDTMGELDWAPADICVIEALIKKGF